MDRFCHVFDLVPFPGYVDIGIIPVGAREIRIEEVAEAGNFLALRSEDPEKYFLNGGWTIQWNGDYRVAGTTFTYKRTGNWENLTSPGPTVEPVWIQVQAGRCWWLGCTVGKETEPMDLLPSHELLLPITAAPCLLRVYFFGSQPWEQPSTRYCPRECFQPTPCPLCSIPQNIYTGERA